MDIDKIKKQMDASQRKLEELQSQLSTLSRNSQNNSDFDSIPPENKEYLFNVVFEGKPLPGIALENAINGLARFSRKQPEDITHFFNERPKILKRKVSKDTALRYHKALQNAGLASHIANSGSPLVADEIKKRPDIVSTPLVNDKVPCSKCGAMILPSTSERTGGLCMTCYKASPDYESPSERNDRDTPKDKIFDTIAIIFMLLGLAAGILNYIMQFSEMWEYAGMILTLAAFPLFPMGGIFIGAIIGTSIGWIVSRIISIFTTQK